MDPVLHPADQFPEKSKIPGQDFAGLKGLPGLFAGEFPGFFNAEKVDGGGGIVLVVETGGFSEGLGILGNIEQVVDQLKGESEVKPEFPGVLKAVGSGPGSKSPSGLP